MPSGGPFATELKRVPLKDLCQLGGWKEPQTVLKCYQRADEATMREALASRRPVQSAGHSTHRALFRGKEKPRRQ